jgi:hypothetical protein
MGGDRGDVMSTQINPQVKVTGRIQAAGSLRATATFYDADAQHEAERKPDLVPTTKVVEQTTSVISPGLALPLHR